MQSVFHHDGEVRDVSSDNWLALFNEEDFSAAIFDCDGTLVDSMDAHFHAMQSAAREQGHEMVPEWYRARTGLDRRTLFLEFQKATAGTFDTESAIAFSIERFNRFAHLIKPISTVLKFADALRRQGTPLAVATNAERAVAMVSLSAANATAFFDHVVGVSDAVRPKPSPELFERAADLLGHPYSKTLVVEDSPQGVQAAMAAKMSVLQLVRV